jgi:hypothetical protein
MAPALRGGVTYLSGLGPMPNQRYTWPAGQSAYPGVTAAAYPPAGKRGVRRWFAGVLNSGR